jgi:SH3 domain-containing YSC84-like protein 1
MRPVNHRFIVPISMAITCLGLASAGPAVAARMDEGTSSMSMSSSSQSHAAHSAADRVNDSLRLVQQMKESPALSAVLQRARGVFIIPHYGKLRRWCAPGRVR